jgi:hypothetical protein
MHKTLTYSSFVVATVVVLGIFVTATSYTQLGLAVLLYPLLAYIALRIFPRKVWKSPIISINIPITAEKSTTQKETPREEKIDKVDIADIDKRAFLKLIGLAGLSFFLSSLFTRRGEELLFNRASSNPGITSLEDPSGNKIHPAEQQPTDGYQISEIDDNDISFLGYINTKGQWYIMKGDGETGSFRYTKGDTDFSGNWGNRENLTYAYYHELFSN